MGDAIPRMWAAYSLLWMFGLVGGPEEPVAESTLAMSPAVACRAIEGFEQYEPLPDASLTSDEKLLVYYRPVGFRTEKVGERFRAHFVQDARIRRLGEKTILMSKSKLLDYEAKSDRPPDLVFLRNTISLKGLKPGRYELDIILHDKIAGGGAVTQALKFRVVAAPTPPPPADGATKEADGSP